MEYATICETKNIAEVLGFSAGVIANYSSCQQAVFCYRNKSAKGICWKSLYGRSIAICLFASSTYLYAGPVSMIVGNVFTFANTMVVIAIKWNEEKPLSTQIRRMPSIPTLLYWKRR